MNRPLPSLAEALKEARRSKELSQRELGKRVGLPQSHISKIESGAVDPQLSSLVQIARALDLELTLIPRNLLPALKAIRNPSDQKPRPAYRLDEGDDTEDDHD